MSENAKPRRSARKVGGERVIRERAAASSTNAAAESRAPAPTGRRQATENRLIEAAQQTIAESGFGAAGVNQISARAGVPKQLIYRYFGNLNGLLLAAVEAKDFWQPERLRPFMEALAGLTFERKVQAVLKSHIASLRNDTHAREIRRFELTVNDSELAAALAEHREQGGRLIAEMLAERPDFDPALFGIVAAGISYLILRERNLATYIGLPIRGDEAWKHWESAALRLLEIACTQSKK